ncbi:hypothetical protein H4582DRAFT_2193104 [Lactarius indigo]|nr:hypothetical protein H4582DRAFT_2193104 [Lactarius indigo]
MDTTGTPFSAQTSLKKCVGAEARKVDRATSPYFSAPNPPPDLHATPVEDRGKRYCDVNMRMSTILNDQKASSFVDLEFHYHQIANVTQSKFLANSESSLGVDPYGFRNFKRQLVVCLTVVGLCDLIAREKKWSKIQLRASCECKKNLCMILIKVGDILSLSRVLVPVLLQPSQNPSRATKALKPRFLVHQLWYPSSQSLFRTPLLVHIAVHRSNLKPLLRSIASHAHRTTPVTPQIASTLYDGLHPSALFGMLGGALKELALDVDVLTRGQLLGAQREIRARGPSFPS